MFVKLQTSLAGVNGSHPFGAVIEMEDAEAARYCAAGLAVEATEEQIAAAQNIETNSAAPPADSTPATDATPNLDKMTKAQIAAHAAEVHGLDLDPSQKKAEMIAAVAAHVEAANPPAEPTQNS